MLYNENLHEEEQHLIQQIAEQTERGKIGWELTEYNPLSFLNEDKIDKNPAVICQSFSFEAIIGGSRFELDVMENIDVPSGMGDYTITLTRDETENYLKIEDALSFDCDRYECTPEEVAERFADSPHCPPLQRHHSRHAWAGGFRRGLHMGKVFQRDWHFCKADESSSDQAL